MIRETDEPFQDALYGPEYRAGRGQSPPQFPRSALEQQAYLRRQESGPAAELEKCLRLSEWLKGPFRGADSGDWEEIMSLRAEFLSRLIFNRGWGEGEGI